MFQTHNKPHILPPSAAHVSPDSILLQVPSAAGDRGRAAAGASAEGRREVGSAWSDGPSGWSGWSDQEQVHLGLDEHPWHEHGLLMVYSIFVGDDG